MEASNVNVKTHISLLAANEIFTEPANCSKLPEFSHHRLSHGHLYSKHPNRYLVLAMILTTRDGPLYFEIDGAGPPLVFASGWAMSCECWRPVVNVLKRRHRCLIYDTRGIARSQPASIDARFSIEDHAEDLHALMDAADVYDAAIVGHETGALIAAECAVRHQQDFASLVIVSPRAPMPEDDIKNLAVFTPASLALRELANYPLIRNLVARGFRRAPKKNFSNTCACWASTPRTCSCCRFLDSTTMPVRRRRNARSAPST